MNGCQEFSPETEFVALVEMVECADAVAFGRERLGFMADALQERVLRAGVSRGMLNCTRQWGKSTVVAVKAVRHAFTQSERLVVGVLAVFAAVGGVLQEGGPDAAQGGGDGEGHGHGAAEQVTHRGVAGE